MEGWGRNRNFEVKEVHVWTDDKHRVWVDIYSKQRGKTPPINLTGTPEEFVNFSRQILGQCGVPAQELDDLLTRTLMELKLDKK